MNITHKFNKKQGDIDESQLGTIFRASGNLFIAKSIFSGPPHQFINCKRSAIKCFTANSARRMRRYLRECMSEYSTMVTLTYPCAYPSDGKAVKEHLRRFLQECKREWERHAEKCGFDERLFSAFWFLEFQERGAPHFHIFLTWAPNHTWVARRWYEIVDSEDNRHLQAGTRTEYLRTGRAGTISYASKYAAKMEQKIAPEGYENVGRFWGVCGRRSVVSAATYVSRADVAKKDVLKPLDKMIAFINQMIFTGIMDVIVKDIGVRVYSCNNPMVMKKIRVLIHQISAVVYREQDFFEDAELSD